MGIAWITTQSHVDIETGEMSIHWPSYDTRIGKTRALVQAANRELVLAFIAGYKAANPNATTSEIQAAVLRWGSG